MKFGALEFDLAADRLDLLAASVRLALDGAQSQDVYVAEIDPELSDTAAFCEQYEIGADAAANCVAVEAKRGDRVEYAACVILATDRVDVNGVVRKHLDARKISFAPMDMATSLTAMEFGAITPIGLPAGWKILVDEAVVKAERVIIGSGVRSSKLLVSGKLLADLPGVTVMNIAKVA